MRNARLRVVPHFSSGIVERAWKSPHARKGDTRRGERNMIISLSPHRVSPFSRGVIFTLARVSLALLSLRKKWGTTCSLAQCHPTVWLQIIFCSCVMETVLFSFLRSLLRENGRSLRFPRIFIKKNKLGDRMIKQPSASANNWSARHWQITIFCDNLVQ